MDLKEKVKETDLFIVISAFTVGVISSPWSLPFYYYIINICILEIVYFVLFDTTPIQRILIVLISFIGWIIGKSLYGWFDVYNQHNTDFL